MRVALVGAGMIAARYAEAIDAAAPLELAGVTDVVAERAEALAATHGTIAYGSLDELLADDAVDTVVNLTTAVHHVSITRRALEAGKHVHTEKPVALEAADAWELAAFARERGVRLSCAPATLLGESQQTVCKLVRDGAIGRVRVVYAEANWGRIEAWHPAPESFYEIGALGDVGIYPLTLLTAMLGPVRTATAFATVVRADRLRLDGRSFEVDVPDLWVACLELESGVVVRLTASFWVPATQRGLEVHGDDGSIVMPSWLDFDAVPELVRPRAEPTPMPLLGEPFRGVDWARALVDLAEAIDEGRPHRMGAEHAAHVVEILNAIDRSRRDRGPVRIESGFDAPEPLF